MLTNNVPAVASLPPQAASVGGRADASRHAHSPADIPDPPSVAEDSFDAAPPPASLTDPAPETDCAALIFAAAWVIAWMAPGSRSPARPAASSVSVKLLSPCGRNVPPGVIWTGGGSFC